MPVEARGGLL
uniref:Uncharacterized protein n=1 Tax=Anguilla anguilla TaxID=7936 RepID=A0A0E9XET2_ANGAN